jgi:hypothetical protein
MSVAADFFRGRSDEMIDLRHPLAVLGAHIPRQEIEAPLARQSGPGCGDRPTAPQNRPLRA